MLFSVSSAFVLSISIKDMEMARWRTQMERYLMVHGTGSFTNFNIWRFVGTLRDNSQFDESGREKDRSGKVEKEKESPGETL
jgi:hypothetical protein